MNINWWVFVFGFAFAFTTNRITSHFIKTVIVIFARSVNQQVFFFVNQILTIIFSQFEIWR